MKFSTVRVAGLSGTPKKPFSVNSGRLDLKTFFKLIGSVVGAVGGLAGLLLAFGYITLHGFLRSFDLYGLASFPIQFYREASITFFQDFLSFYCNLILGRFIILIIPILILIFPFIVRSLIASNKILTVTNFLSLIFVFGVIVITWRLDWLASNRVITFLKLPADTIKESPIFFLVSLPTLLSLFFFIAQKIEEFSLKKPFKRMYGPLLFSFFLLFLSIPHGYGTFIYDLRASTVVATECTLKDIEISKISKAEFKILYLLGYTSDREIFFDFTDIKGSIILLKKDLLNSIKLGIGRGRTVGIRHLYENASLEKRISPEEATPTTKVDQNTINAWIEEKSNEHAEKIK